MNNISMVGTLVTSVSLALFSTSSAAHQVTPMSPLDREQATQTLYELVNIALQQDHGRQQIFAQSKAMSEMGVASSTQMDPKLKMGVGGLPVDSFRFDEDPMTNISIGLMQQFERGSTLQLRQKQANQNVESMAWQVDIREREIANRITEIWLELGFQQLAERTLEQHRSLMVELETYTQVNYGIGKSEAQDLLNAQLNVSKFDERLHSNQQMQHRLISLLSEWMGDEWVLHNQDIQVSNQIDWQALDEYFQHHVLSTQHFDALMTHPKIKMAEVNIATNETQVALAEQAYTPQFGVEVMYGYRQADNMNGSASDLLSAYVTMDIPLFTSNRQDRSLTAAQHQVGAARSSKDLLLVQMNASVNALITDRINLDQRLNRYQSILLPQAHARTQAVERGYQNNTAQFNDVISASVDELTLALEYQRLVTDLNIVNNNLTALLRGYDYHLSSQNVPLQVTKVENE